MSRAPLLETRNLSKQFRVGSRFSSLVLGVVNSKPFQMNMKSRETPTPTSATTPAPADRKGAR